MGVGRVVCCYSTTDVGAEGEDDGRRYHVAGLRVEETTGVAGLVEMGLYECKEGKIPRCMRVLVGTATCFGEGAHR